MPEEQVTLNVVGMHCMNCVASVEKALRQTPGVSAADVDLAANHAQVTFDPQVTSVDELAQAVREAGFEASRA